MGLTFPHSCCILSPVMGRAASISEDSPLRYLSRWGPTGRALPYDRYLALQELLRKSRRELLLFCEHPPTLTAGIQGRAQSLLLSDAQLRESGIAHLRIGRGGDYTAHEPGQSVIYAHIDLEKRAVSVGTFFRLLLDVTRDSLRDVWGLETEDRQGAPGLYMADGGKIASIGIMFKRFFTSFGVAVNVSNGLSTFRCIHACGHPGTRVTSVAESGGDPALRAEFERTWERLFRSRLETA